MRLCDVGALYYSLLRPWDNDADLIRCAMDFGSLIDEKTKILDSKQVQTLAVNSALNGGSVRSFAAFYAELV